MKKQFFITLLSMLSALAAAAQFTNSGNMRLFSGASVAFYGDVTNNGTITDSGTVVVLRGSVAQTIGGTTPVTFNNLTLNNSDATGVTLMQDMNVRGTLVFTDGYLNTTATNVLQFTATAAVSGASNNSFVSGPAIKTGNTAFVFPTGKNVVYAPISISAPAVVTDQFTAEYFQVSPNAPYNVNNKEATLDHVSQCEYWMLDRTAGSSNVAVTLSWDTRSCGVTAPADLRVARWDGSQWTDKGNGGTTGTTAAGTVISAAAVTGFGPFTLASSGSSNPLPVELLGFVALCEDEQAVLRWSTASELHNDFFTIEASSDALDWETAGIVDGAGTTASLTNYAWTDLSNPGRDTYYRLTQTDTDGETTVHDIVHLGSCGGPAEDQLGVYPNPAANVVLITVDADILDISVFHPDGKRLDGVAINSADKQLDFSQVPDGIYFIRVTTPGRIFNKKIVIAHH
jgi:hypothetical protein